MIISIWNSVYSYGKYMWLGEFAITYEFLHQ
jgi:hypothetical protein